MKVDESATPDTRPVTGWLWTLQGACRAEAQGGRGGGAEAQGGRGGGAEAQGGRGGVRVCVCVHVRVSEYVNKYVSEYV